MTAVASQAPVRSFHLRMALISLALAVLGFVPTFFAPLAQGTFQRPPVFYVHGLLFFAWVLFYCAQTWLVARGRMTAHREWGIAGAALATAMVFSVFVVVVVRLNQAEPIPEGLPGSRTFTWTDVAGMLYFSGCVGGALANTRRPQVHKRLMLLATVSLLTAAEARLAGAAAGFVNGVFGAGPRDMPGLIVGLPIFVTPAILMLASLLINRRSDGKVSRIYLCGLVGWIAFLSPLAGLVGASPFGLAIADLLKALPN